MRQLVGYFRLLHAAFNLLVMIFFIYQGWTGIKIRRQRDKGMMTPSLVKRHRTNGPLLVASGVIGFLSGTVIVMIHFGVLVKYPLHLATGSVLALSIFVSYAVSRAIKARDPQWRTLHLEIGVGILGLYAAQTMLGLGILF